MLKSGIALAGVNTSAIKGKSDGIVTALKLSGLGLKGTDLVVLSNPHLIAKMIRLKIELRI